MASAVMLARSLYNNEPPNLQTKLDMNPTLLVSWWATGFSTVIILIRVAGRYVRTEKLFGEDRIMFWSIIPLFIRMGLVHVVLIWGTNNTKTAGLTPLEIHHRSIASRLVLGSRIFYALFIWMAKWSILEFLKRLVGAFWHTSYEIGLQVIRYFLIATFIGVLISTLAECHPFSHYWHVIPDPGPHCREGIAQLMTMGICDIITDLVLVVFPVPIVILSEMPVKRKISLTLLFALSLALVAVTAYRVPATISRKSSQQFRSLIASIEILAAAGVTNAIVIGSFIRDRGMKKAKFKSVSMSADGQLEKVQTRRATITAHHWGSDEDLVRDFGMTLDPSLHSKAVTDPVPPRDVAPPQQLRDEPGGIGSTSNGWSLADKRRAGKSDKDSVSSTWFRHKMENISPQTSAISPGASEALDAKKPSFFDIGGLLEQEHKPSTTPPSSTPLDSRHSSTQNLDPSLPTARQPQVSHQSSRAFIADVGGLLSPHREESDMDRATALPPAARKTNNAQNSGVRNHSRVGIPPPALPKVSAASRPDPQPQRTEVRQPSARHGSDSLDFADAGGLLK